ncbi:hypothetical protein [Salipiger sp. PrR002]|uniref:hypothetical protein n=1 Tax=Salipiger sp. PrR002 TaxID=2706489 RepID=UPI0013BB1F1B|nr:hypothetical protein [Salipiger sp. PrR002]NDW01342.1 hypothetical protein [Salipiger sp. PrR002]NDW58869.1 hypothetical protein [Salipiger sp. PrR004]
MKCTLHIGTEKTGSTTLQGWLYQNRENLRKQGVALSDVMGRENNRKLAAYFQGYMDDFHIINGIETKADNEEFFRGFEEEVLEEINVNSREGAENFIITSEHFHSRVTAKDRIFLLRDFLKSAFQEVHVICYFRSQVDLNRSLYSTAIRVGHSVRYSDFSDISRLSPHYYDYNFIMGKWCEAFGESNVTPVLYGRENFLCEDIRKDFLRRAAPNFNLDVLDYSSSNENEKLSLLQLNLGRVVNESCSTGSAHRISEVASEVKNFIFSAQEAKWGELENSRAQNLYEIYHSSNVEFAKKFLGMNGNPFPVPQKGFDLSPQAGDLLEAFSTLFGRFVSNFCDNRTLSSSDRIRIMNIICSKEVRRALSEEDFQFLFRKASSSSGGGEDISSLFHGKN